MGVDLPHRAALHSLQQLLQLAEGQLRQLQFIQVLAVEQPPPQVVPAAMAHGLLHAGLDLSAGQHHLVVEQWEQRGGVEQLLGLLSALRQRVKLIAVARGQGGRRFGRRLLPQVLLGAAPPAGFGPIGGDPATQLTGITVDLRKLLETSHVSREAGEELPLTGHDHIEPQPKHEETGEYLVIFWPGNKWSGWGPLL